MTGINYNRIVDKRGNLPIWKATFKATINQFILLIFFQDVSSTRQESYQSF